MECAFVGVVEEANKVCLCSFLEGKEGRALHLQIRLYGTGRVPSLSKGPCSSGIYGSHEGRWSQGANDGVSSCPQRIWLGCMQLLLQDEGMGPFPQLTCVRSVLFWPLSNCWCCYFICVLVCVCFAVGGCSAHWGKREEALWHKIPRKKKIKSSVHWYYSTYGNQ